MHNEAVASLPPHPARPTGVPVRGGPGFYTRRGGCGLSEQTTALLKRRKLAKATPAASLVPTAALNTRSNETDGDGDWEEVE